MKRQIALLAATVATVFGLLAPAQALPPTSVCATVRELERDQYKFATPIRAQLGNNASPVVRFQENPTLINVTNRTPFTAANARVFDANGNFLFSAQRLFCDSRPRGVCFSRYKYTGSTLTRQFMTRAARATGERRTEVKFYWQVNPRTKACIATFANRCMNVNMNRVPCNGRLR
jgi:hypothetical protein